LSSDVPILRARALHVFSKYTMDDLPENVIEELSIKVLQNINDQNLSV